MNVFKLIFIIPVLFSLSNNSIAQEGDSIADEKFERKKAEIFRTELAPVLDGKLDDEIWQEATVISDMHQFQPVDHGEPSEKSEFRIAYSEKYFYIAARLYDNEPEDISARQLVQGQTMRFDDAFEFILDTFNNGRTGYYFQVNPNGIRAEGVYENPESLNRDWSGIWQVETSVDDEGWTAEVAIPFNTLNFDPQAADWGFTVARTIARKQEEIAWSSFNRTLNPTTTGIISGIHDIKQGLGLDIIPSLTMSSKEDYISNTNKQELEPSLDIFYKFTPNLTGVLTINTDFSATEVDNRQVNLSRFSLFFPEKRDFFLQDVDIFSFGGLDQNGIPFYSRRIGLDSATGQPVGIDTGVKLTGRVGRWNVGVLGVQQEEFGLVDSQNVFVGRASANILDESSIGVIFTSGDPNSNINNLLMGTDFRYQNTRFTETHNLQGNLWYQQSDTTGLVGNSDEKAYGINATLSTQGTGVDASLAYEYFGDNFNPALGFANRTGIDHLQFRSAFKYFLDDSAYIRYLHGFMNYEYTRKLETEELESETLYFRYLDIYAHSGDRYSLGHTRSREGLDIDFTIRPGIIVPAGKYSFSEDWFEVTLSDIRVFTPSLKYTFGEFYTGNYIKAESGIDWRPNEHFFISLGYTYQDIKLPQGEFAVRLVKANVNYAFNSKWSWINLIQYDTSSNMAGLNSRLRWNPEAGENLYFVINYNFDAQGVFTDLSSNNSEVVLKYTKTLRF